MDNSITNVIVQLTGAIDCLTATQKEIFDKKFEMNVEREKRCILALIIDISTEQIKPRE